MSSSRSPAPKSDGLAFAADAAARGAGVIVGERAPDFAATFVRVADARAALALAAARFYPRQPERIVAVTGTSGKTSVAAFVRQIWARLGLEAASLGTIGVVSRPISLYGSLTTPDPIALHETLDRLARPASRIWRWRPPRTASTRSGSTASASPPAPSPICRATTWIITRPTRPISPPSCACSATLLPAGAPAVIDADSDVAPSVVGRREARGLSVFTVGARARRSSFDRRRARGLCDAHRRRP